MTSPLAGPGTITDFAVHMSIRNAVKSDLQAIGHLLSQLGYPVKNNLLTHPGHHVWIYETSHKAVALISLHFIPQLSPGDLAIIDYLVVDESVRDRGIGKALEEYAAEKARERKCERIQLHCSTWRTIAHQFYQRQGYQENLCCFVKWISG